MKAYSPGGARQFDYHFMGEQVYEQPFTVIPCDPADIPPRSETGEALGRHLDGCRIGFDLGASDRKVSAVIDGQVVYSEEVIWEPRKHADPDYHYRRDHGGAEDRRVKDAARGCDRRQLGRDLSSTTAPWWPRSSAASQPSASPRSATLFLRIRDELNVPLEVINDGDVTALAGSMSLEDNGVLGIALGSSEAAGYVDTHGHILGWLNELAFAPIDYNPTAPVDEWSGDIGVRFAVFFAAVRLPAGARGGHSGPGEIDRRREAEVRPGKAGGRARRRGQDLAEHGHLPGLCPGALCRFLRHQARADPGPLHLGRGGTLILDGANTVLQAEFPELAARIHVQLPDEKSRRVGQSIAAASLPADSARTMNQRDY